MLLSYERGAAAAPKGHALAYFTDLANPGDVYATYLVVPPIAIDLMKYMPPMFANKMSLADMENIAAIPLPPVPEKVRGLSLLKGLAELREDDLIFLGTVNATDIQAMLSEVADASQEYLRQVSAYNERMPLLAETADTSDTSPEMLSATVDDVLFSLMTDRDKLSELSKLVGKLRYAVEGNDKPLATETVQEMEALGRHLPDRFHMAAVIDAAGMPGEKGRALAQLYVERCYKVSDEDFRAVEEIEGRIRQAEAG